MSGSAPTLKHDDKASCARSSYKYNSSKSTVFDPERIARIKQLSVIFAGHNRSNKNETLISETV